MKKVRFVSLLSFATFLVYYFGFRESRYQNKTTSEWIGQLADESQQARNEAIGVMAIIGPKAFFGSKALLAHSDPLVREAAVFALENIHFNCVSTANGMNCAFGYVGGKKMAIRTIPKIRKALEIALPVLGRFSHCGYEGAVRDIELAAGDSNDRVSMAAQLALTRIRADAENAFRLRSDLLKHDSYKIRVFAKLLSER